MRTLLVIAILLGACSKKTDKAGDKAAAPATESSKAMDPGPDEKPTPTEADKSAGAPSKDAALEHLRDLNAALEAKDYAKAVRFMAPMPGVDSAKMEQEIGKLSENKEISAAGIEILAAKAKWGKLTEVVEPAQAERWASRFNVPVDQTWGFAHDRATVGFHYDGKELRLIRLNNVGKIE